MALTLIRTGHLFIRIYISVLVSMEDMEGMAEGGDQEGILSLTLSPSLKKIPKLARLAGKVAWATTMPRQFIQWRLINKT